MIADYVLKKCKALLMDDQKAKAFFQQNAIDFDKTFGNNQVTVKGAYMGRDEKQIDGCIMYIKQIANSYHLIVEKDRNVIQDIYKSRSDWLYSTTFLQIIPDILFFSSDTVSLAAFSILYAYLNGYKSVPCSKDENPNQIIVIDSVSLSYLGKADATDSVIPFSPETKPFEVGSFYISGHLYIYSLIPTAPLPHLSDDRPCIYSLSSNASHNDINDGSILAESVMELERRIGEKEEKLKAQPKTPLTKAVNESKLRISNANLHLSLEKQQLLRKIDHEIGSFIPNFNITSHLDFHGNETIDGEDLGLQIERIRCDIDSIFR